MLSCFGRWTSHQLDKFAVEFVLVEIFLNYYLLLAKPRLAPWHPDERVAVARPVINGNIHVETRGLRDDAWIEPGRGSQFIPQVTRLRVLGHVLRRRRRALRDLRDQ